MRVFVQPWFNHSFEDLVLTVQQSCRKGAWCCESTAVVVGEPSA